MMDLAMIEGLEGIPSVSLADLVQSAALQTRRDRKYILPIAVAERLVGLVAASARVLTIDGRRAFRYESVYFDTPDLVSYLASARRRPHRFKVRTRTYLDSGLCNLELKTRDRRGRTVKQRIPHPVELHTGLTNAGREFVARSPLAGPNADALAAVLTTRYTRSTLLLPGGIRVTIDVGLEAVAMDGRSVALPDMAVLETKSSGLPTVADRALWELGHRPIRVSKFGTSLAILEPGLPANRWNRALRQPWQSAGTCRAPWPAERPTS